MLQEPMEVNASLEAVSALKMPGYVGLLSGQLVERDEMWHDATYEDLMGWMGCFKIVLYMYIYRFYCRFVVVEEYGMSRRRECW